MRICSLLPSITEILFELGLGDSIVAVTHECDWPPEAKSKPHVTRSRILGDGCSSAEIDRQVRSQDGSLYDLDGDSLAKLRPDLILTQSLCPVCAVSETTVREVARTLPNLPKVLSYHPTSLFEVLGTIEEIGHVTGVPAAADQLVRRFRRETERIRFAIADRSTRPRVVCLEWTDPPFACGHWTPELVEIAGGMEMLGRAGQPSRSVLWEDLMRVDPSILLVTPCGFPLQRTLGELCWLRSQPRWTELEAVRSNQVFAADGSAYFNRPGPRLLESLQILAEIIHPKLFGGLAPANSFQRFSP